MLKLIFIIRWPVAFILSLIAFALAAIVFQGIRQDEVDKALALQQGIPAAVSLIAFNPKRDIHPMDEVTAPTPNQPYEVASLPAVPGLILFLIALVEFAHSNRLPPVPQMSATAADAVRPCGLCPACGWCLCDKIHAALGLCQGVCRQRPMGQSGP